MTLVSAQTAVSDFLSLGSSHRYRLLYELIKEKVMNINNNANRVEAIALCRVSTVKQSEEGSSIEAQDQRVREAAEYLNAQLVKVWESKGVSSRKGKNFNRKDLTEMFAYAKTNKRVKFVIVDEPDRFMRELDVYYWWKVRFENEAGAKLVYAKKPELTFTDSPMALFEEMFDVFRAEASNHERISKTTDNMKAKVAQGYFLGQPKTGYKLTETKGLHEPKEPEWSMIREGFLQVLEGIPIKDVVSGLNANGYRTRYGKKLDSYNFKNILVDPYYAGIIKMSNWTPNPNGLHKAMITPEQHEQLKSIVKGVEYKPRKQFNPEFRLSNLMNCKECHEANMDNCRLVGYNHSNGKGNYYKRYKCRACGANILQPYLHQQLSDTLLSLELAQDKTKDFISALRKVWEGEQYLSLTQVKTLQNRSESLKRDKEEVILRQVRGTLSEERADIAINALDKELHAIQEQIQSISDIEDDFVEFVEFAINTVRDFKQRFWELDSEHLRWCKQLLFPEGFSVSRDRKVYTPKISEFYRLINIEKDPEGSEIPDMVAQIQSNWNLISREVLRWSELISSANLSGYSSV